jgi:DNA-binding NtrC family response regulator
MFLQRDEIQTTVVRDLEHGLKALNDGQGFQLITLDLSRDATKEADLAAAIRKSHPEITMICMGSETRIRETSVRLEARSVVFLKKPFSLRVLAEAIQKELSKR